MATIRTDSKHYSDIASAIREKSGLGSTFKPEDMATAILEMVTGGGEQPILNAPTISFNNETATLTITENSNNGTFTSGYKVYLADSLVATVTVKSVALFDYTEFVSGANITVVAVGENFTDSLPSNAIVWNAPQLNAPSLSLNETSGTITITDNNSGRETNGFAVYANGQLLVTTTSNTVEVTAFAELTGSQTVTAKALSPDNYWLDSALSGSIVWARRTLIAPTVEIDNSNDTLTITDNNNGIAINGFEVYANGELLTTTVNTSVVLSDYMERTDQEEITVKVLSGHDYWLDSGFSEVVIWSGVILPTEGLAYTLSTDGTYYSCSGLGTATDTDIVIASEYNGKPVAKIANNAFGGTSITSVIIPESVISINDEAFKKCSSLTSITIPDSVTYIGMAVFYYCTNLKSAIIGNGITNIYYNAFEKCTSLESVTLGNRVEVINHSAFLNCTSLASINIPEGVTSIGNSAFFNCSSLESITIPESVTSFGTYVFNGCSNLAIINIPDGVTDIGSYMFYGCSSLKNITIPDSVTYISNDAFYKAGLTIITIPESVTSIGSNSFNCQSLTDIYVPWAEGAVANAPWGASNATIHYNSTV